MRRHGGKQRAHGREAHGAEGQHERQGTETREHLHVEEHGEQRDDDRLDDQHQEQVARDLPEVDRRFVAGSQQQSLPAVVLALDEEGAPEPDQAAQHEAQPEEPRQHRRQPLPVAQRELEEEQQQQREEEQRVQRLLGPPLAQEVFPEHDPGPARVAHASSTCSAYSFLRSSAVSAAAGVSSTTRPPARMATRSATSRPRPKLCVVSKTAPPAALNAVSRASSHLPADWSSAANGSSSKSTRGCASTRRASASRRFMPSEKVRARSPATRSSSTAASAARSAPASAACPPSVAQNLRFSRAVRSS